jgi:hypothetical protein
VFAVSRTIPAGAVGVWVDIEQPGLTAEALTVALVGDDGRRTLPLRTTLFGLAGVGEAAPGAVTTEFVAAAPVDAHIAVTFVDAAGLVLDAWDDHLTLEPAAEPGEEPGEDPGTGGEKETPDSGTPDLEGSSGAGGTATGDELPWTGASGLSLMAGGAFALITGGALLAWSARPRRQGVVA